MFKVTKILVHVPIELGLIYTYPGSPSYSALSIPSLYGFLPCYWPLIHLYWVTQKKTLLLHFTTYPLLETDHSSSPFFLISWEVREARPTMGFREVSKQDWLWVNYRQCNIPRYTHAMFKIQTTIIFLIWSQLVYIKFILSLNNIHHGQNCNNIIKRMDI